MDSQKQKGFFRNLWRKKTETAETEDTEKQEAVEVLVEQEEIIPDIVTAMYKVWLHWQEEYKSKAFTQTGREFELWKFGPVNMGEPSDKKYAMEFSAQMEKEAAEIIENEFKKPEKTEEQLKRLVEIEEARENGGEVPEEIPDEEEAPKPPVDAKVYTYIAKDNMLALLCIFPPRFGGSEITEEAVAAALQEAKIKFGVNQEQIKKIVSEQAYMQIFLLARGLKPVNGTDGSIKDFYPRISELTFKEDENGVVDFKDLNLFQNIEKGTPICQITPPTEGMEGFNVLGEVLPKKDGQPAKVPRGNNTVISEDGTQLLAGMDGFLSFEHEKFKVENKLVIHENVDNSVGNINFLGDVEVFGDVCNGFEVKATGSIHIRGMVEGARVIAEGSITVEKGVNGNKQGLLEAKEDINCKFIENCKIVAGGCVHSESIIWSDVMSDDTVYADRNKGVIIGGSIAALHAVEAKMIGNKSNQKTTITLGNSPRLLEELKQTEKTLKENLVTLDKILKNIAYLKGFQTLTPDRKNVLDQLQVQGRLYDKKRIELETKLKTMKATMGSFMDCRLKCNMLYPPTKITIGNVTATVSNITPKAFVYLDETGELKIGTL